MTEVRQENVLLVDDDRFLTDMYSLKLMQSGYVVRVATSVEDALNVLSEGYKPDAIVFDIVMPQQDGFDFLQALSKRSMGQGAALVALTNQSASEERERAESLGTDAYIVKASTVPSEVVNMVTEAIQKHRKA
jgi:CheY-like chemotaxis protein